jgi:glycerol uptake facilitator-like aquaporin
MNPARSLGPAVMLLRFESLWVYLLAPCLGAAAAVPLSRVLFLPDRSDSPAA